MGRKTEEDYQLEYLAPSADLTCKPFVSIPKSEIVENVEKWKNTLVGYVLGDKPFYMHLKAFVGRMWKPNCSLEVHSRDNGYFFFSLEMEMVA